MFEIYAPDLDVDLVNRGPGDHAGLTLTLLRLDESPSLKRAIPRDSAEYYAFIADATNAWIEVDLNNLPTLFTRLADAFQTHSIVVQSKPRKSWWTRACSDAKLAFRESRSEIDKKKWYKTMKNARSSFFKRKIEEAEDADSIWGLLKWKQPRPSLVFKS